MAERVAVTIEGGVADVRLNRPDKMNAVDAAMFAELVEAGEKLKNDPSVRAVVLSGEGRAFCAGLDFGNFQAMASKEEGAGGGAKDTAPKERRKMDTRPMDGHITHRGQQAAYVWTELDVPVIAAVTGVALGAGCQVALGADIRIIAPDAKMSVLEIRWGLTPDMIGTQALAQLVGTDVAKELTFTGRMVEGEEAVAIGLATKLSDDPVADALAMAHEIADKNPHAIRGAKNLFRTAGRVSDAEQFALERETIAELIGSPNQVESVKAFFEKRPPVFDD